ncbi:hypothetical protein [Mucilaginibacter lappiensis]|uniref:Uncharacterized protein n=1 Tax=Mucilaginibacter lappiensis TaxID=354630 RepID=A0A841J9T5_9SPHI|nr:hypothetical protein [Mucilaginibacter lappiensis]MBB6127112.1 hypothetical protein [Mucilaginibacter lappiensis]
MKLIEIKDQFVMDVGAPCPLLIADDHNLRLIFYSNDEDQIELRQRDNIYDQGIIELKFIRHNFFSFGPPNDEALNGHPYYELNLGSYSFYELQDSDLIAKISTYGRHHHFYNTRAYEKCHHYILTFKEQLFECVAHGFEVYKHNETTIYHQGLNALNQIYKP